MAHKRISFLISETCHKFGIDYRPGNQVIFNDAKRLGQIYLELKIIAGDLAAIADRHKIPELKLIHDSLAKIEKIEHDIIKLAKKLQ
jgi:hypothetical protein